MDFDPKRLFRDLSPEDRKIAEAAWEAGSGRPVEFIVAVPRRTLAVSLTGTTCSLDCKHCGGHYLKGMKSLSTLQAADLDPIDSLLISGGSDSSGAVPIAEHIDLLLNLPARLRLNLHLGIQPIEPLLPLLKRPGVTVSCDIVGDRETVREVFGLEHEPEDYMRQFCRLREIVPTVPHLTMGLRGGRIYGEAKAIHLLAAEAPQALTILIFRPTPGTVFAQESPPDVAEVMDLLIETSWVYPPETVLHLGCMRPAGVYRRRLDLLAWLAGFRSIVMPDRDLVRRLEESKVTSRTISECCSLDASPEQ